MAKYIMPEQKHIEFVVINYKSKIIDFNDFSSKIKNEGLGVI